MRAFGRDPIRGGHYGQRSCGPHQKAEHMAAPTNAAKREESSCQLGAVHTWHKCEVPTASTALSRCVTASCAPAGPEPIGATTPSDPLSPGNDRCSNGPRRLGPFPYRQAPAIGLPGVGDDFRLFCMDREIYRLKEVSPWALLYLPRRP